MSAARAVIDAAVRNAEELRAPATVAVVDAVGTLKAMVRMDGAPLVGVDLARRKAVTCVIMGDRDTATLVDTIVKRPQMLAAITTLPDVVALPGGLGLLEDELLIGAVGVSSPTGDLDIRIANAAAAVLAHGSES
ncbi:heme-binding protein [uncultured Jatrophihabitans sp.]|uniref:GlcG/HbpS family heme-binding protein n=1 Tax=uncultured Jatrophihabitans sp. TaxID=1610747 RepID=UPI0035CABDAE